MNHSGISEICAGLVLNNRIAAGAITPSDLMTPYDMIVKMKAAGKEDSDIIGAVGFSGYQTALSAGETVSEREDITKYLKLLEQVSIRTEAARIIEKELKKLKAGDECNTNTLLSILGRLELGVREFVPMGEVDASTNVWKKTYWEPWDTFFGGVPRSGVTIVAAPPGVGKTSLIIKLINAMTSHRKKVGVLTLELTNQVFKMRWKQINPDLTDEQANYALTSDEIYDVDQACASMVKLASEHKDLWALFLDFSDMLIPADSEESTGAASRVYMMMANTAKKLKLPIFLLSQLNSAYVGGLPQVNHIRWSRLAEALASMIVLVYNPGQILVNQGEGKKGNWLPDSVEGKAYIIEGKSRFGYKQGGIGAIQLDWGGATAWGDEGEWFSK